MPLTKTAATLIVLTLVSAFPARAQISINISNPNDMVFSSSQNQLYITTDGGTIQRYDLGNQALLSPFSVGGILNGADITTDGNFLYVTQGIAGPTQGILEKVDLSTGMKTDLFYALASNEGGGWDVAIGSNGSHDNQIQRFRLDSAASNRPDYRYNQRPKRHPGLGVRQPGSGKHLLGQKF